MFNNNLLKKGVEKDMFFNTAVLIKNQGEEITRLSNKLDKEKEVSKDLRNENSELFDFRTRVINIMNNKGTIVSKYDKIKELVDNLQTEN